MDYAIQLGHEYDTIQAEIIEWCHIYIGEGGSVHQFSNEWVWQYAVCDKYNTVSFLRKEDLNTFITEYLIKLEYNKNDWFMNEIF